jgi:phosphate transport system permease protein
VSDSLERGTPRGRLWADRFARHLVGVGGLAIVASLAGILVFLLVEVLPLFEPARVQALAPLESGGGAVEVSLDPYAAQLARLDRDGMLRVQLLESGAVESELPLAATPVRLARAAGKPLFAAASADGGVTAAEVTWSASFEGAGRSVSAAIAQPLQLSFDPGSGGLIRALAVDKRERSWFVAVAFEDGGLELVRVEVTWNDFTRERSESVQRMRTAAPPGVARLLIDAGQRGLFAVTDSGRLLRWSIGSAELGGPEEIELRSPATSLAMLGGGRALLVGQRDGSISQMFRVPVGEARIEWTRVRSFPALGAPIVQLEPSARDRSFLARAADGQLALFHATSEQRLWQGGASGREPGPIALNARGDRAVAAWSGGIDRFEIDSPHPESAWRTFFARVWYEDAPGAAYAWQSTGGTDAFEPKLSLVPLLLGTFKGTLYALLIAVPLGMGGAIYVSQFMHPRLAGVVKPTVELMASLPSVVLGFVAGLWLAPRLEHVLPGVLAMLLAFPLAALAGAFLWRVLPGSWVGRLPGGSEIALHLLLLSLGATACVELSPWLEARFFRGDVSHWLQETTGLLYDQRNALVAGIAMGFAVIPIVLSLSDEALSNVPASLSAASLALGATRWQTVARVVLPAASPGLFAAVMIGLGRAIGETMIVLMATGNTPILDWGPFNGFRTLSANIAVEIPEAPHGGTLYRTLFASALGLFALTFALNTAAELVRERLRRRYAGS